MQDIGLLIREGDNDYNNHVFSKYEGWIRWTRGGIDTIFEIEEINLI